MLTEVARNHNVKICVVEYADNHRKVNEIVYSLPEEKGIGTFVWEPQEWGDSTLFDWKNGRRETNKRIDLYIELNNKFNPPVSTLGFSIYENPRLTFPNLSPYLINIKGCKIIHKSNNLSYSQLSKGYYISTNKAISFPFLYLER